MNISKKPLVSVVMPNFNNNRFLAESIDSILNQTYDNLELIIVDGHSTDGSIDIIQSYVEKDPRVNLIFDNGEGVGAATNIGCRAAKGEFIARMDSDDVSFLDRIEIEATFLTRNSDFVLVSSAAEYIDEEGNHIGRSFPITSEKAIKRFLLTANCINQPMAMFRREAYEKVGGYPPLIFVEDRVFWCKLAKCGRIKNLSKPLGKYRILNDSLGHTYNPYDRLLQEFRNKMVQDDEILNSDIELYNSICNYSKQFRIPSTVTGEYGGKSRQEKLYDCLKIIVGSHYSEEIVCRLNSFLYLLH